MPRLRPFQREDVDALKEARLRALVASAPGTGKTPTAIRAIVEEHGRALPAAVIAPASVTRNWAREIRKWAPGVTPIVVDDGDTRLPNKNDKHTIYIISWALLDARWSDLVRRGIRTVVADEAHYAKNPDAQRSRALWQLTQRANGILLLTGTPIVNTKAEMDVLTSLLGENPLMLRRLLEDVAQDIPPKSRSYLNIELRPKHQKEYDKAANDFEDWLRKEKEKLHGEGRAEYEVERILAAEALAKIGYLRRLLGEYKVPAAADWIARAVRVGEPVVVFVEHQAVLKKLSKALRRQRIRHGILEGSTTPKRRQELVDQFQANKFPVFLCTKAGKEGITLTAARHLLFVERFFTAADEEQAEDRIRRIGQVHETTVWFLHANGTVDDRVDNIVRTKRSVVRTAIGSPDIQETDTGNVESLIRAWGDHTQYDRGEILPLGQGDPLDPLPKPRETHAIVFRGSRWKVRSAAIWCKMNGYMPEKKESLGDRFKLVLNPIDVFVSNQFESVRVSKEIRIITGKRLSSANERQVRNSRRACQ